ncbi:hypothetical protein BaRGS_00017962 [Batillaria attramentaria]|uniref:Uncharacterized protein n=1 Tax=Batillaria attramentaria TaxID=370345 RepID=A0ABD0KTZ7_9CAEN
MSVLQEGKTLKGLAQKPTNKKSPSQQISKIPKAYNSVLPHLNDLQAQHTRKKKQERSGCTCKDSGMSTSSFGGGKNQWRLFRCCRVEELAET